MCAKRKIAIASADKPTGMIRVKANWVQNMKDVFVRGRMQYNLWERDYINNTAGRGREITLQQMWS